MTWTWLERIDPADHANRWYAVGVQPSLFDPVALIRLWGSRESGSQRLRVEAQPDWDTARAAADRLIRGKVRQKDGYQIVGGYEPPGIEELGAGEPLPNHEPPGLGRDPGDQEPGTG